MATEEPVVQSSDLVLVNADTPTLTQQRVDELGRILLEFRLTSERESEKTDKTLKRLRRQAFLLKTGLLLTVLLLGGSVAGGGFWLRSYQVQLAREVNEIAQQGGPEGSFVSRLGTLESQVQNLEETVPQGLPHILEMTGTQLEKLSQTVNTLEQDRNQRQSVAAILANALQDLVEEPPVETPSPSPPQNEPAPESPEPEPETPPETPPETSATETAN